MFAKVWSNLSTVNISPARNNATNLVAFVDDGTADPCQPTSGTLCVDYCSVPEATSSTPRADSTAPDGYVHNAINSPIMAWERSYHDGLIFAFDCYTAECPPPPGTTRTIPESFTTGRCAAPTATIRRTSWMSPG